MNIRRVCITALFSALVAGLGVGNLMAQRIGFRVGIAPALRAPVVTPGFAQPLPVPFGVASSTFGFPATQTPFIVNSGGFGVHRGFGRVPFPCCVVQAPQIIVPGQVVVPNQILAPGARGPGQIIVRVFPGFVPGGILVSRPTVFQQQTVFPRSTARSAQVFVPGTIVTGVLQPSKFAGVPVTGLPPIGTPRQQVVSQFGSPTVSIVTGTGETLHFGGGVTIFIQNGQVASPR